ncbi:DUF7822 domain-containing protein [Rhodococcus maanshanensis]|uniref:DUF7822 domain-containing protein n=1 Tax=Rhodococcus maanshanensis TaxID=183556 RepID=A0A1H7FNU0_9NOCA|nr:hypothetical protein [Rhodococcus maanshanensis]SEK27474.1 hypothetical protein SAMN05444583_101237 [Rhodococcus maanshanensis]
MANRTYLYTTPLAPQADPAEACNQRLTGISEWPYAIPLVPRILVSVDPRARQSIIWDGTPDLIAVTARCGPGITRLEKFLSRIHHPGLGTMADDALRFLRAHTDPDDHFVLECGEIFAMDDEPFAEQGAALLSGLADIDAEMEAALAELAPAKPNFWQRVFAPAQQSIEEPLHELGLGHWSDALYFELDGPR